MDAQDLTQQELAEKSGVSMHTVFRAVSKGMIPRGGNIEKIATALGVPAATLFEDPHHKPPPPLTVSDMTPEQLLATLSKATQTETADEAELLRLFRSSPAPLKAAILF